MSGTKSFNAAGRARRLRCTNLDYVRALLGKIAKVLAVATAVGAASGVCSLQSARAQGTPQLTPPRMITGAAVIATSEEIPGGRAPFVGLMITIERDGRVSAAEVVDALAPPIDARAVAASRELVFEPAVRDGTAIRARIRFQFRVEVADSVIEASPSEPVLPEIALPENPFDVEEPAPALTTTVVEAPPAEATVLAVESSRFGARARARRPQPGAATQYTLEQEELTTVPGTFGEPLRVVATLPGVARSPFGLGFFLVRGASFENTGFFVDGFPVPVLYHFFAGPAVISSRLVERLDFYPGGYPVSFGRFNAGVIALHTGPLPTPHNRIRLEAEVDLFRASALAVIPLPDRRGSIAVALRRSYFELLLPLIAPGIDLSYGDFQVRGDFDLGGNVKSSLFIFGSTDQLDTSGALSGGATASAQNTSLGYDFIRGIGSIEARLPGGWRLKWAGSFGYDQNDTGQRTGKQDLGISIRWNYFAQRLDAVYPHNAWNETRFGVDTIARTITLGATVPLPSGLGQFPRPEPIPSSYFDVDDRIMSTTAAAYVEHTAKLAQFELTGGIRAEYFRYADVSQPLIMPRAVVRWRATDDVLFKAATGLFSQEPIPFQLTRNLGDQRLTPYQSWQTSIGTEVKLPESIEVEASAFYTQMWSLARATNQIVAADVATGVRRRFFVDDGQGRAYGMELMVRRRIERGFYGWISYTFSRSERFIDGGNVVPFSWDQTHVLNLALSYAVDGWRFGARFQLATGRPWFDVVGARYDADADEYRSVTADLGGRLPTYHQLDLRIDRDFTIDEVSGSVYLEVLNVYNQPNAEGYIYQFDYARRDRLPGLPTLGTLGVRVVY